MYQLVVYDFRARLSIRFPPTLGEGPHTMRPAGLLPTGESTRSPRTDHRMLPRLAREASGPD